MYEIQKGNPPLNAHRFPILDLEVGEFFEFPMHLRATVQSRAQYHGIRSGRKFSVRGDKATNTARCYRVS